MSSTQTIFAVDFDYKIAERCILGTAADLSYREMYAVACALRNIDDATMVYTQEHLNADVTNVPEDLKAMAKRAWYASEKGPDITAGGELWRRAPITGNYVRQEGYAVPHWLEKKLFTKKVGIISFYKIPASFKVGPGDRE